MRYIALLNESIKRTIRDFHCLTLEFKKKLAVCHNKIVELTKHRLDEQIKHLSQKEIFLSMFKCKWLTVDGFRLPLCLYVFKSDSHSLKKQKYDISTEISFLASGTKLVHGIFPKQEHFFPTIYQIYTSFFCLFEIALFIFIVLLTSFLFRLLYFCIIFLFTFIFNYYYIYFFQFWRNICLIYVSIIWNIRLILRINTVVFLIVSSKEWSSRASLKKVEW